MSGVIVVGDKFEVLWRCDKAESKRNATRNRTFPHIVSSTPLPRPVESTSNHSPSAALQN